MSGEVPAMHVHISHQFADGATTDIIVSSDEGEPVYPDMANDFVARALDVWRATCCADGVES